MAMDIGGGGGGEGESLVEINVTPMVDVLLSLLIIFMVASPGTPNEQTPLNIPQDTPVQLPNDPNASLLITVNQDGTAELGSQPLAPAYAQMVKQFEDNEKAQSDNKVVVKADPKVPYGKVIRVMAAAHEAGIAEVGIASDKL